MIDYEKLDKLMELPVSEELLGAYIEGNLSDVEADSVRHLMSHDEELLDVSPFDVLNSNIDDGNTELTNFQLPFISLGDSSYDDLTSFSIDDLQNSNIINNH